MLAVPARPTRVADADRDTFEREDMNVENVGGREVSPARPVYRYSVIPGGAYTADELAEAIERDPVVAAAYRTVSSAGVHAEVVPADRLAYMSYRIGDQIYWTKHQIRLRRGETILTSGSAQLRGRCGNGISLEPLLPTAASEPAPLELEALSAAESSLLPSRGLPFELAGLGGQGPGLGSGDDLGISFASGGPFGAPPSFDLAPGLLPGTPPGGSTSSPFSPETVPTGNVPVPDVPVVDSPVFAPTPGGTPPAPQNPTTPGGTQPPGGPPADSPGPNPEGFPPEAPPAPLPTPEPGTLLLVGGGVVTAALRRLRSRG
jgi:PEP-CTERM motif